MPTFLETRSESWAMNKPFRISGGTWTHIPLVHCRLRRGGYEGQGEAAGVDYHGETVESMLADIASVKAAVESDMGRAALAEALPPGGARNALDCALWALECRAAGVSIFERLDIRPRPVTTVYTVGIDEVPVMGEEARQHADHPVLKVKLDADRPVERIRAVHEGAPGSDIVVDVNGGWSFDELRAYAPVLAGLGVSMIEQPLPEGEDAVLERYQPPVVLCADESCQTAADLPQLQGRYGMVNIKLDKTGGLTAALELVQRARDMGFELMVGNMLGTSLGMAPALVVAQFCRYADVDGPLLQREDREPGLRYERGVVSMPDPTLWG